MGSKSTSKESSDAHGIFLIRDPMLGEAWRANLEHPELHKVMRAEVRPLQPLVASWAMGKKLFDVMWTTHASGVLISEHLVQIFNQSGITGWATYPVLLHSRDRSSQVHGYHGLAITGRCGAIEQWRGEWVWRDYPGGTLPRLKGVLFDLATWDGADFFMSRDATGYRFASSRVKDVCRAHGVKNLDLRPISDVEIDETLVDPSVPRPSQRPH